MWLLYVAVVLMVGHSAAENPQQFFQGDQTTFSCNHSLPIDKLSQVQWMINGAICANLDITSAGDTALSLNCGLENRAEMNITHLVVSSLETRDDGGYSCKVKDDDPWADFTVTANFNVTINVRPENHTFSVDEVSSSTYATCDKEVKVGTAEDSSTLKCSVDSKPPANITWSSVPVLNKSWQNETNCDQRSDKVYHCINTLTVPKEDVQTGTLAVTCHVQVQEDTSDRCIKLAEAIAKCNTTSCLNGGSCNSATGCQCAENWKGKNCSEVCDYITTPPESYDITLGDSHTFVCNSSESVTWRKDGVGNTLSLPKVHQKQAGFYYCSSSSSECKQAVRFTLRVLHHWDDGLDVKEVKVEIGSSKIINCNVTGKPVPNVQWSRLTDGNYDSLGNASEGYSVLEFDSFKETDAGEYVCSASYLDVLTNWTISIKVDDGSGSSSGLPTWVVVVIVLLAAVLLGIIVLFILLKLLLVKAATTAAGPFGSTTKLIVVGLLVVILLPGVGLILVISYYLIKVTGPSHGVENGKQVERKQSTATTSKVHPEIETNEPQVISSNGIKGGTITPPTGAPPLAAVSGAQLAHSATVTQTHGGAPMKLEPLASTENTPADGQEKKKKKKKKKHKKNKQEKDVENQGEDMTAETRLVSHDAEET